MAFTSNGVIYGGTVDEMVASVRRAIAERDIRRAAYIAHCVDCDTIADDMRRCELCNVAACECIVRVISCGSAQCEPDGYICTECIPHPVGCRACMDPR